MLFPENVNDVRKIILEARETGKGLVPVSSGPPHIHGGSANPDAETVCFSRMDRIIKIDRRSRYCRIEPGVTFGDLIPKLAESGMRLNMPFLPRANKSVAASVLEREGVLVPKYQYDYPDPLLTVEAVFGTGDIMHTGSASGPGPVEENRSDMVLPWGPATIDYYRLFTAAQGTMGFLTWATMKTEVKPSLGSLFFILSDELKPLTELANNICRNRVPDEIIILDRASFTDAFADSAAEEEALSGAPEWIMLCRVCGFDRYPEERVSIYEGYVEDACARFGLTCEKQPSFLPFPAEKAEKMLMDCDRREVYWKERRGVRKELLMLAPPSKTPDIVSAARAEIPGAEIIVQPQVQGRAFRIEIGVYGDGSEGYAKDTDDLFLNAAKKLMPLGAYFDRPYGRLPELVYPEPVSLEVIRKLKGIFDPDHILNPGKLCF